MSKRTERVAERIKQDLAKAIPLLKNPDVGFVTVTSVDVSPDLQNAKVYVSILPIRGHEDPAICLEALKHSAGYLQAQVGKSLRTRVIPSFRFYMDTSAETAMHINTLIKQARSTDKDHKDEELENTSESEGDSEMEENHDV